MSHFDWHKEAKSLWDDKADFWNQSSKDMWETGSRKSIVPFIQKHFPKGSFIADLGCGDGYGTYKLAQAGFRVTGIDLSEEMIEKAKREERNNRITFVQGDLTKLPFEEETFSGLMSINAIEWTEHPLQALKEMHRVLKKDHLLCVGILGPTAAPRANSYNRLYGKTVVCNTLMPWELEQLAQENGWEVIDGQGVFKRGVTDSMVAQLSRELKQSLTFMWLVMLKKR
ncbi:SAM-dependent methyltransferase [Salipaludibacillus keqinensis]|uniref:SAM-dependent methyltransferase n=1 Tax=Salipaludibacillus keqinensis TaxID=2045207 RepID=A0A323TK46_9BACI|nr:class I SAM-dependent methyltransferase [Salipaludibacillus keqinensis]PYZ94950.1 SAM-dependent methyltransferase [Salipaludibacillus keqinensis]